MRVMTAQEAENLRIARRNAALKAKWEFIRTPSMVEAVHFARDHGWKEQKVQVRYFQRTETDFEYSVEPYEDCGCQNLLKYSDFFD